MRFKYSCLEVMQLIVIGHEWHKGLPTLFSGNLRGVWAVYSTQFLASYQEEYASISSKDKSEVD